MVEVQPSVIARFLSQSTLAQKPLLAGTSLKVLHWGPRETTSATAEPGATEAPAAGFCEMTMPAGTLGEVAWVTVPTTRPAPVMAAVAAACVRFTTFGTVTFALAATSSSTAEPPTAISPPNGDWPMTVPGG